MDKAKGKVKGPRRKCRRCKKLMAYGSRYHCWDCHATRHVWRKRRKRVCSNCSKKVMVLTRGICSGCYHKKYMKEYHAAYERQRRAEGKDESAERKRNKTKKRREWRRQYHLKWYAKNKEKALQYQRDYRRQDMQRTANYKRRRLARVAGLPDTLTVDEWEMALFKHEYKCAYCYDREDGKPLEREHDTPADRGGGLTADNIVPACGRCNRRKKTMTGDEYRKYMDLYP